MLNWIAIWVGVFLFGLGGPLQNSTQTYVPISNDVLDSAKLPVFWGNPELQGLHIGFFIALGALVVFWLLLNRTTLGYGVRAVGFNPEAARYGGINVARNYFLAMADLGCIRGPRRRHRHPRLAVPARDGRRADRQHRIRRHRRRAARSQHRGRVLRSRPSCSADCSPARRPGTSIRRSSSPSSRRT